MHEEVSHYDMTGIDLAEKKAEPTPSVPGGRRRNNSEVTSIRSVVVVGSLLYLLTRWAHGGTGIPGPAWTGADS